MPYTKWFFLARGAAPTASPPCRMTVPTLSLPNPLCSSSRRISESWFITTSSAVSRNSGSDSIHSSTVCGGLSWLSCRNTRNWRQRSSIVRKRTCQGDGGCLNWTVVLRHCAACTTFFPYYYYPRQKEKYRMSQDRHSRNHSLSHICGNSAVRGHRRDQIPRIDNEKLIIVILGRLLNSLRTFNLSEMICLPSRHSII